MSKRIPCRIVDLPSSIPVVEVGDAGKGLLVTTSTSTKALPVRLSTAPGALRVSGLFTPASLPNLAAWYSADSGVLNSISPDVPATNGQTVRRWLDRSGNDRHLNQSTLANQPTLSTSGINSLPSVNFSGVSTFMDAVTGNFGTAFTIYVVTRLNALEAGFQVLASNTGATTFYMGSVNTTNVFYVQGPATRVGTSSRTANARLWTWAVNGTAHDFLLNNTTENNTAFASTFNPSALRIGADNSGISGWRGLVSEFALYTAHHTPTERLQWWSYAQAKYGL